MDGFFLIQDQTKELFKTARASQIQKNQIAARAISLGRTEINLLSRQWKHSP